MLRNALQIIDSVGIDIAAEGNALMMVVDAIDHRGRVAVMTRYRADIQSLH